MSDPLDDSTRLLDFALGFHSPLRPYFQGAAAKRNNGPGSVEDHIFIFKRGPNRAARLWVVDRILEPPTIPHFFEFLCSGDLPGGGRTEKPLPTFQEVINITRPFSQWAPPRFHHNTRLIDEWLGVRIGSYEDPSQLLCIAKELHALKARIWIGLDPMSERHWKDLELDDPENFSTACRTLGAVIRVFQYLNQKPVKQMLRETFNRIARHLEEYEQAINANRRSASADGTYETVSITMLWYEFVRAHFDTMCARAHAWVFEHYQRLQTPLVQQLSHHRPPPGDYTPLQWTLTDRLHDLDENMTLADVAIFLPMDGFRGDALPSKDYDPLTAEERKSWRGEPIKWCANFERRRAQYYTRVRFFSRYEYIFNRERNGEDFFRSDRIPNDPDDLMRSCEAGVQAQARAREELRGKPEALGLPLWMKRVRDCIGRGELRCGYIAYRLHHGHSAEEWERFRVKFEADVEDWGREMVDIDDIREACKVQWLDGKELGVADGDVEAAKKHFREFVKTGPGVHVHENVLLIIDEHTLKSYLEPSKDNANFVLVADAKFDPKTYEEEEESPGYAGTLRVLGSLLWDDLGATLIEQGLRLQELWPLAMSNPSQIYRGIRIAPVLKFTSAKEVERWELASAVIPRLVAWMAATRR